MTIGPMTQSVLFLLSTTLMLHVVADGQNNGNYAIFNEPLIH